MKYEKWSLGYWLLKQYIIFVDWLIHGKIIVAGKDKIPKNKPIIFAPNHQNALSDPMAILLNTRFQPVWLARADIFKNGFISTILRFLKIMPVYRLRDGKENLSKNDKTFADSVKVLKHNFALALFPEAAHSGKRQMLPHKKAVARIVFMAEEKTDFSLDIQIIPTGVFYSSYWKFNRSLIVNFGNPIPVKNFMEEYKNNPNDATVSLRKRLHKSIHELIIDIRSKKYYHEFEAIRKLYGKHFLKRGKQPHSALHLFESDKLLTEKLDELEDEKPQEADTLVENAKEYLSKIKKLKLRSWLVEQPKSNFWKIGLNKLILLVGLPVFIYGFLLNALPFFLIDILVREKVKDQTFWSTFFLAAGIILFPLFYILELLALGWLIPGFWLKLAFLVSMPFAGKLAFNWYILLRKTIGRIRLLLLKWFNRGTYKKLLTDKEELFATLDRLLPR